MIETLETRKLNPVFSWSPQILRFERKILRPFDAIIIV